MAVGQVSFHNDKRVRSALGRINHLTKFSFACAGETRCACCFSACSGMKRPHSVQFTFRSARTRSSTASTRQKSNVSSTTRQSGSSGSRARMPLSAPPQRLRYNPSISRFQLSLERTDPEFDGTEKGRPGACGSTQGREGSALVRFIP